MSAIVIERVYPAAKEVLWQWLTEDERLSQWSMKCQGFVLEIGNVFIFETPSNPIWGGILKNTLIEFEMYELLVYTCQTTKPVLDTRVKWELTEAEEGTKLRLTHGGFTMKQFMNQAMLNNEWKRMIHEFLPEKLQNG